MVWRFALSHWLPSRTLLLIVTLSALLSVNGCDIFDSVPRPTPTIHMYGSALNALSFQPVSDAQITVYLNNKTLRFRGSYTLEIPIYASLRITVTAPGYARYDVATTIKPQASEELRSPLMLQPLR